MNCPTQLRRSEIFIAVGSDLEELRTELGLILRRRSYKDIAPTELSRSSSLPAPRRSDRQRISVEFLLVPVWISQWYGAGSVEFPNLISRQVPTDRSQIVA